MIPKIFSSQTFSKIYILLKSTMSMSVVFLVEFRDIGLDKWLNKKAKEVKKILLKYLKSMFIKCLRS